MIGLRQQAGPYPLGLPVLIRLTVISSLFLAEVIHGQPNYYFKASAPAVKSLPRIGRRSDGEMGGGGGGRSSNGGGGETPAGSIPVLRSLESPGGIAELWQSSNGNGNNFERTMMDSYLGSSHLAPSVNNQLSKVLLWRRLFGEGNNDYGDSLLDNLYRSKS